jgi:uncharacterized protein with LGFP repeats
MQHNAAVDFFARATPDDTEQILRELLRTEEHTVISILADLSQRRAEMLIRPLAKDFPWLSDLPRAVAAMASQATTLGLDDSQEPIQLKQIVTETGWAHAYVRSIESGVMYWRDGAVCTVAGQIAKYHILMGGPDGILGFPSVKTPVAVQSKFKTMGMIQDFEDATVYSSNLGTHTVIDEFFEIYQSTGQVSGWLGFPTSESEAYDDARIQRFEGGAILSSVHGTFPVRKEITELTAGWIPVSQEIDSGKSPVSERSGTVQSFRRTPAAQLAIYSSEFGIHPVGWKMLRYYHKEGGPASRLGFPVAKYQTVPGKGNFQVFEGGCVYLPVFSGNAFIVPRATVDKLNKDSQLAERLGWPICEEELPNKAGTFIQYFEHGIVTRESGGSEIWLHPSR